METRECTKCHELKEISEFYVCGGKLQTHCKICCNNHTYAKYHSVQPKTTTIQSLHSPIFTKDYKMMQAKSRVKFSLAVKSGKLIKPNACQKCGKTNCRIEGHHYLGYEPEHALDVKWLCNYCHSVAHRIIVEQNG